MKLLRFLFCLTVLFLGNTQCADKPEEFPLKPAIPYLSPEETLKTFVLPEGYRMELVLDETSIKEPVVCVFDGNGRMYVAEMRSYMQDIDGTNEIASVGRVSRHESTKGDGNFDKHSVYADKLLLPRQILPLDNRVLINETNTNDINIYQDTKGDGVADKKDLWFAGGPRGGNLEHQASGLVWCQDNWIYQAANSTRLRWTGKEPLKESTPGNGGQWGLGQDNYGKMWFCNAGGEIGQICIQVPIIYGGIDLPNEEPADYREVYPLVGLADVQGGHGRHRPSPDNTLNHMTASCGSEIVRGDRLPEDLRGDSLICEPVGRLIRRAKVENHEGMTYIHNAYDKKEFLLSTDPNFRPVNICNGPDGCIYIVDMYRGIIQEGAWVNKGSYLRKVVQQYSLDKNFGRGRVWRLVHKDFQPGPQPHMLDETPAQWVAHLEHPNGWWRDTAQKLLVLKSDKSVVPALIQMAGTSKNPLARIHAIWTLEGLDALERDLVSEAMKDPQPQVRIAAIRAGEALLKKSAEPELLQQVKALSKDPDPNVALQTVLTGRLLKWPDALKLSQSLMTETKFEGVKAILGFLLHERPSYDQNRFKPAELARLQRGEGVYRELCYACHGYDGKGMSKDAAPAGLVLTATSTGTTIAPPLSGSTTVLDKNSFLRVLMNGMAGPVSGKTYDAQMIPMNTNDDEWLADVASYVRNSFGNHGSLAYWSEAAHIRAEAKERTTPWTREEIQARQPKGVGNPQLWKLSASHNQAKCVAAIDGDIDTRWDTGTSQVPGMWFQIELPEETEIAGLMLNSAKSGGDYPRGYKVQVIKEGKPWGKPIAEGKGTHGITELEFAPVKAKAIRITQTGSQDGTFWSIHELMLYPPNRPQPQKETGKKKLLAVSITLGNRSDSINAAEKTISDIAERTGEFEVEFLRQPGGRPKDHDEKWQENVKNILAKKMSLDALKNYDGVIFLNTSGDLPLPDKQGFVDWIKSGKAFIGIHGAADTLHEFKPYIDMLGGEFEGHAWNEPVTLHIEDRKNPASAVFPSRFEFTDEINQFKNWDRAALHTVISLDSSNDARPKKAAQPGEPEKSFFERGSREDKYYAVSWAKEFGTGRVFYTGLGQSTDTWNNEKFQQHLYGGIKWALGENK